MSTRTKIVIALIVLVVLFFLYDSYKKRKAAEEAAKKPACKEIGVVKWTTEKRQLFESIRQRELTKIFQGNNDFLNAYKQPALEAGAVSSLQDGEGILEFGAWEEAHKKMLERNYCEQFS